MASTSGFHPEGRGSNPRGRSKQPKDVRMIKKVGIFIIGVSCTVVAVSAATMLYEYRQYEQEQYFLRKSQANARCTPVGVLHNRKINDSQTIYMCPEGMIII